MRVRYTRGARDDLRQLSEYSKQYTPEAGPKIGQAIRTRISQLAERPYMGKPAAIADVRSLTINRYPYTVYYRVLDQTVLILHVRHQRRAPWDGRR